VWRYVSEGFGKHLEWLLGFGADLDIGNCLVSGGLAGGEEERREEVERGGA
jgi:hypothetical protein